MLNDRQCWCFWIQYKYTEIYDSFQRGIILSGNDLVLKWIRIYIKYQQNIMIKFDLSDHRKTI